MVTVNLADSHQIGVYIGEVMLLVGAVVMVIVGLIQMARSPRRSPPPPGPASYPAPAPWGAPGTPPSATPPGYPPIVHPPGAFPPVGASSAWPASFPPAYPPPPPAKRRGMTLIVVGSVIFGLVFVGTVGRSGLDKHSLAVGQCITADDAAHDIFKPTNCNSPEAVYMVASNSNCTTCPDGRQPGYSSYALIHDRSRAVCLVLNLIEGECYIEDAFTKLLKPTECSDARASFKVVQRVAHSTDTTACGPDTKANVYPVPPLLYCLGSPNS